MRNLIIWTIVACFTQLDLDNAVCNALCRNDGKDGGSAVKSKCRCYSDTEFEIMNEKLLPIQRKKIMPSAPILSWGYSSPDPQ